MPACYQEDYIRQSLEHWNAVVVLSNSVVALIALLWPCGPRIAASLYVGAAVPKAQ